LDSPVANLDLYFATERGNHPSPGVVVIHGGGFSGGDKGDAREQNVCRNLSGEGYVCASINYALASREDRWACFPLNVYQVKSAIWFLREHAEEYGIDPTRMALIGGSAGGTLSLLAAMTLPVGKLDPPWLPGGMGGVQAVVNLYGPTDFSRPEMQRVVPTPAELVETVSAVRQVHADVPPILTLQGTEDKLVPVSQAEALDDAVRRAGGYHQLHLVQGGVHSFHLQPPQEDLRSVVLGFLRAILVGATEGL
jgi:acetyl esterase/lipase